MEKHEVNPEKVKKADLVVCIPSYNEADSISHPTMQASEGLSKYFRFKRSVIINCDNNSPDDTKKSFLDTPTKVPKIYISTPPGIKGKGNNFKKLFQKVADLEAKAVVVVDADLKSISPEWIKNLGEPLFNGFSFVAPLYLRHKYDGTITNAIAYPLLRALYGRRVRQPIGGDFGFSSKMCKIYLKNGTWTDSVSNFGIDAWMTTLAINQTNKVCQSFLGGPKIHRTKDPSADLGPMFKEVVGTIFYLMQHFKSSWIKIKHSKPTTIYGFGLGVKEMPPRVMVDQKKLINKFKEGFNQYREIWKNILSENVYQRLLELSSVREDKFTFSTDLWAMILYDAAVSYQNLTLNRELILESLIPLYYGKTYSFIKKTRNMSPHHVEGVIEEDCVTFEMTKPHLARRWEMFPSSRN